MSNEAKNHPLDQSSIYRLKRKSRLSKILRLTPLQLRRLASSSDDLYKEWDELKKDGAGLRRIESPANVLKMAQRRLTEILSRIAPPDFLFCPVKRRCYVTNAAQHRGHRVVKTLDIKKYFPNTKSRRVFWFFHTIMQCERDIAGILTRLACYNEHLPTGSPLSPILAFYAHMDMWTNIANICKQRDLTLTVYIDDVTVSGAHVPESIMWDIRQEISKAGHRYHKEKVFIDRPAEITGVFVEGQTLVAPHRQYKKIRIAKVRVKSVTDKGAVSEALGTLTGLKGQLSQIRQKSTPRVKAAKPPSLAPNPL